MRRNRPIDITDAPEWRGIPLDQIEVRSAEDNENELIFTGYASTFQEYDMYGGPSQYGWIERIDKGAFDKTLREKPDLMFLVNHQGMPLARTKSGTLKLSVDDHGLFVEASLDREDPDVKSLEVKMRRGDMDEMSFAFRVKKQEWSAAAGFEDDDQSYRVITELSLHKGDVSIVNFGANPTTSAGIRSADSLLRELIALDEEQLAEVRSNEDLLTLVRAKVDQLVKPEPSVTNITVNAPTGTPLDGVARTLVDLGQEAGRNIEGILSVEQVRALEASDPEETEEEEREEEAPAELPVPTADSSPEDIRAWLGVLLAATAGSRPAAENEARTEEAPEDGPNPIELIVAQLREHSELLAELRAAILGEPAEEAREEEAPVETREAPKPGMSLSLALADED